jgi:hypothetical protein
VGLIYDRSNQWPNPLWKGTPARKRRPRRRFERKAKTREQDVVVVFDLTRCLAFDTLTQRPSISPVIIIINLLYFLKKKI